MRRGSLNNKKARLDGHILQQEHDHQNSYKAAMGKRATFGSTGLHTEQISRNETSNGSNNKF